MGFGLFPSCLCSVSAKHLQIQRNGKYGFFAEGSYASFRRVSNPPIRFSIVPSGPTTLRGLKMLRRPDDPERALSVGSSRRASAEIDVVAV